LLSLAIFNFARAVWSAALCSGNAISPQRGPPAFSVCSSPYCSAWTISACVGRTVSECYGVCGTMPALRNVTSSR
jgi:hypothetical protein